MLAAEDGPWDLVVRLRRSLGNGALGSLLDCYYCLSFWVAVPFTFALGTGWLERALLWPALSGGAVILERMSTADRSATRARYVEGAPEDDDGMLRK